MCEWVCFWEQLYFQFSFAVYIKTVEQYVFGDCKPFYIIFFCREQYDHVIRVNNSFLSVILTCRKFPYLLSMCAPYMWLELEHHNHYLRFLKFVTWSRTRQTVSNTITIIGWLIVSGFHPFSSNYFLFYRTRQYIFSYDLKCHCLVVNSCGFLWSACDSIDHSFSKGNVFGGLRAFIDNNVYLSASYQ